MRPAAGDLMQDDPKAEDRAPDIQEHLNGVGPDHGCHPAFEGIKQSQAHDDQDGDDFAGAQNDRDDDGEGEHTHAFGQSAQHQECSSREPPDALAEAAPHQFVSGKHFAAKILRQEQSGDHDARQQVAQHQLQKLEVSGKRERGRADHGERAGFSRDDGQRDGPPGRIAAAQEIILQIALALAKMRSEPGDRDQVNRNRGQVQKVHGLQRRGGCAGWLLHGHAMQSTKTEHQIAAINADHFARGKQLRERVERDAVIRIVEGGNQHQAVRDIEIRVAGRQPLAIEIDGRGHGERDHAQSGSLQQLQIFAQRLRIRRLSRSCFSSTNRARSSMWPCVSSPAIPCFSQMVW